MPRTKQPGSPAHKASKRDPLDEQQIQAFKDHTLTLAQRRNEQDSIIAAVRDIDYAKWKLAMAFQAPPHKGKTRTELASGQFRYLPLGFGQFDRLQLWFLLKCRDLGIPPDQWPPFDIKAPWNILSVSVELPPLLAPPFDVLQDTDESWSKKFQQALTEYRGKLLPRVHRLVNATDTKLLSRQPQFRENRKPSATKRLAPIDLRLEWAVRHHCLGVSYRLLFLRHNPQKRYKSQAITRATQRLLRRLKLS